MEVSQSHLSGTTKQINSKLHTDHQFVVLHVTVIVLLLHILYKQAHCCSCPKWIFGIGIQNSSNRPNCHLNVTYLCVKLMSFKEK